MKTTKSKHPTRRSAIDDSMIRIPEGFGIGITAWHEGSRRTVTLIERRLGDGWLCQPANGDRVFYTHSKSLQPNIPVTHSCHE
jgi:hypothetical protein